MKKIVVNVTAADIRDGKRKSVRSCPVARALGRQLKRVQVAGNCFVHSPRAGHLSNSIKLPGRVVDFVRKFDGGSKAVKPLRFTINLLK